jgi:hypothetical protein
LTHDRIAEPGGEDEGCVHVQELIDEGSFLGIFRVQRELVGVKVGEVASDGVAVSHFEVAINQHWNLMTRIDLLELISHLLLLQKIHRFDLEEIRWSSPQKQLQSHLKVNSQISGREQSKSRRRRTVEVIKNHRRMEWQVKLTVPIAFSFAFMGGRDRKQTRDKER